MDNHSKPDGPRLAHQPAYTGLNWDFGRKEPCKWFDVWRLLAYKAVVEVKDKPDRLDPIKPD